MPRYLIAAGGAARTAATRLARRHRTPSIVAGFAIGVAGWSAAHPFVASFGFTRDVIAGLLLGTAAAFVIGMMLCRRWRVDFGLPVLLAAAWLVMLPTVLVAATSVVSAMPLSWLEQELFRVCVLTLAGLIALGVPAACAGLCLKRHSYAGYQFSFVLAAGFGVITNALVFAPALGLQLPLLIVGVVTAIMWLVRFASGTTHASIASSVEEQYPQSRVVQALVAGSMLLVGVACTLCGRSLSQLFPEAAFLVAAGVGTFLIGGAIGSEIARRFLHPENEAVSRRLGAALAAIGVALPLAAFPWLVNQHLDANAYVSSVFAMMLIRAGTVVACVLPISVGCGLIAARSRVGFVVGALSAGLAAGGWMVVSFGVVPVAVAICCGLLGLNVGPLRTLVPRRRFGWAAGAACTAALVAAISQLENYEPTRAAQVLFSTQAFVSHQRGVPAELLPHLSDTRLVATYEEPRGTVMVWKSRGETHNVRLDGVPIASTSRRPNICPAPTGDVMSVAMPLILHQAPGSLLILGDPIGVSTEVAASFPLREIVCYDGSVGLHDSLTSRRAIAATDDRVTASRLEPRLAASMERRTFDVVVSDPGPPAVLSNAPYFTRDFYRVAASRLTADGMFCQRLRYADFGIEPLQVIAATMRSVFGDVLTMEIGPGEYALIAVRPGQKVVREGLTERLQRMHVRRTLASLGWDWCVPLNLLAVDHKGLKSLADEAKGLNTNANARFAYTLPQEMMRWGPKSQELARGTTNRTTRLLATAVPEDERRDVVDRIAEVAAQRELMVRYPDQPWAYRKEVRAKLVEAPRSVIRPVSGEVKRVRHPDDQHRLDYFEALGKAIGKTSPDTLAKLERFAEPYDPFVTYFLHHEIASLYGKNADGGVAGELAHRLYAAYYADPRDRSVRDIATTLELIVSHPEAIADETSRFDSLNSLVELMLGRWEARGMAEPRSPEVVMIDIEKSLVATQAAIGEMDALAASAGLSDEEWRLRKAAIERTLTQPLRKYRTTLLPHLRTAQRKAASLAEAGDSAIE